MLKAVIAGVASMGENGGAGFVINPGQKYRPAISIPIKYWTLWQVMDGEAAILGMRLSFSLIEVPLIEFTIPGNKEHP